MDINYFIFYIYIYIMPRYVECSDGSIRAVSEDFVGGEEEAYDEYCV